MYSWITDKTRKANYDAENKVVIEAGLYRNDSSAIEAEDKCLKLYKEYKNAATSEVQINLAMNFYESGCVKRECNFEDEQK